MTESLKSAFAPQTRVFLDELPRDIRSKNTDWRYVRYDLPKLVSFEPSLDLIMQSSGWITLRENAKVLRAALGRRIGWPLSQYQELTSRLSEQNLASSNADVVFAHRAFPLNAISKPVIWQNCVLDPRMQLAYGGTEEGIRDEVFTKGPLYQRAAAVQVSTEAEAVRMGQTYPEIANRFVAVPFFTPHVTSCDFKQIERQKLHAPVRILFTGNQVWRKGLDLLLNAFLGLSPRTLASTKLTIISNFVGPAVAVPVHPQITVLRGAGSARVLDEMAQSHIFVNVARFESYGLVFHEAMSQGLACLVPNWEVQRELFDDGRAGKLLPCRADSIQGALEELIANPHLRYELGVAAWMRFEQKYSPGVVARKYAQLFRGIARESHIRATD